MGEENNVQIYRAKSRSTVIYKEEYHHSTHTHTELSAQALTGLLCNSVICKLIINTWNVDSDKKNCTKQMHKNNFYHAHTNIIAIKVTNAAVDEGNENKRRKKTATLKCEIVCLHLHFDALLDCLEYSKTVISSQKHCTLHYKLH